MAGNLDRGVEFVRDGRVVSKVGCCGNERVVSERFKKEYGQVSDENKIKELVNQVVANHPVQVEQYRAGKETILKFLIGMVMKASEGSADTAVTERILLDKLKEKK